MATPCGRLGYEEGMKFILVNDDIDGLDVGDAIWLHNDDNSSNPEFRTTEKVNDDTETYYIELSYVARYIEGQTLAYARGFREGDILQMVMDDTGENAYEGDIIEFINDDGDTCPQFRVEKDGNEAYLYLSHVDGLEPKVGRKVRVIHNCTGGHDEGTEGVIDGIDSDGDLRIEANNSFMYHHADSCLIFDYAEDESSDSKDSEPVKEDYPTKPASEWKKGDKGILRSLEQHDEPDFDIGDVLTKYEDGHTTSSASKDRPRALFSNSAGGRQWVELHLLEPIESNQTDSYQVTVTKVNPNSAVACIKAIRTVTGFGLKEAKDFYELVRDCHHPQELTSIVCREELTNSFKEVGISYSFSRQEATLVGTKATEIIIDELHSSTKKYKYFINGDSIEVTLVGYYEGEPICAYKDRWGDTQLFVAKPSLLVAE